MKLEWGKNNRKISKFCQNLKLYDSNYKSCCIYDLFSQCVCNWTKFYDFTKFKIQKLISWWENEVTFQSKENFS